MFSNSGELIFITDWYDGGRVSLVNLSVSSNSLTRLTSGYSQPYGIKLKNVFYYLGIALD